MYYENNKPPIFLHQDAWYWVYKMPNIGIGTFDIVAHKANNGLFTGNGKFLCSIYEDDRFQIIQSVNIDYLDSLVSHDIIHVIGDERISTLTEILAIPTEDIPNYDQIKNYINKQYHGL